MKSLILLLLCVFSLTISSAQTRSSTTITTESNLTKAEVNKATELYKKMMQSETYKLHEKGNKIFSQKLKGVNPFPDTAKALNWTVDSIRSYTLTVLQNNLYRTKFASIEEARELLVSNSALMLKLMEENAELYDLMKLATAEQLREIMSPMLLAKREEVFGHKTN